MEQEPTGGSPPPESPPPAAPPPAAPPPAAPVAWETAAAAAPVPGAAGFVYADVPNRIIALIIDGIILGVIGVVITAAVTAIIGAPYDIDIDAQFNVTVSTNYLALVVNLLLSMAVSAAYWIYTWTALRGSPGQKVLGMQVGNYPDGATLTQNQAIRRWIALGGLLPIVQSLNQLPLLGTLIGLGTIVYFAYLLYSTAKSPTKQGFHDKFANSVVVKAARVA